MAKHSPVLAMNIRMPRFLAPGGDRPDFGKTEVPPYKGGWETKAVLDDLNSLFTDQSEFCTMPFLQERYHEIHPTRLAKIVSQDFRKRKWQTNLTFTSVTLEHKHVSYVSSYAKRQIKEHAPLHGYVILERIGVELSVILGIPAHEFYRKLIYGSEQRIIAGVRGLGRLGPLVLMWLGHISTGDTFDPITVSNGTDFLRMQLPLGYSIWVVDPEGYIRRMLAELMNFERCRSLQMKRELEFIFREWRVSFTKSEFMRRFRITGDEVFRAHVRRLEAELDRCGLHLGKLRNDDGEWSYQIAELAPNPRQAFLNLMEMVEATRDDFESRLRPALYTRQAVPDFIGSLKATGNVFCLEMAERFERMLDAFEKTHGVFGEERIRYLLEKPPETRRETPSLPS